MDISCEKVFVLYDSRAWAFLGKQGCSALDKAEVLATAMTELEAKQIGQEEGLWIEFDIVAPSIALARARPDLSRRERNAKWSLENGADSSVPRERI